MIRVLVVDDSASLRRALTRVLAEEPDVEIVASGVAPSTVTERVAALRPDVMMLDIAIPDIDPLSFVERFVKQHPLPVVVMSAAAPTEISNALRALILGATEVVVKPTAPLPPAAARELVHAIRAAAAARRSTPRAVDAGGVVPSGTLTLAPGSAQVDVIAVGASTGGPAAIETLLGALPATVPGIVIVQQLSAPFIELFVKRLDALAAARVRQARDGDAVTPGVVLVAPAGRHMVVRREGERQVIRFVAGDPVSQHRPSADVLFESVAESAGERAIGVLLSGMGTDGARGLLAMRTRGAHTFAEGEESCAVYGMPGEAVRLGAAHAVPLHDLARAMLDAARTTRTTSHRDGRG